MPAGMFQATLAMSASSAKLFPCWGEPFTEKRPSFHSRSPSLASSRWAASCFAFSLTLTAASLTAEPETAVVRLP